MLQSIFTIVFLLACSLQFSAIGQVSKDTASHFPVELKTVDPEQQVMSPLDVKDADIQDVIRTISKGYNINIILDKDVVGKVTVHLSDVPVIEGLRTLAKSNGYEIIKEGSVYRIRKATEEQRSAISFFKGKLTVDVQNVDVKDLLKDISAKTATSIVPDSKVEGKITAKLYQVDLDDGLRALLEGNGYEINKRKNIYQVSMGQQNTQSNPGMMGMGMPQQRYSPRSGGATGFYVDYADGKLTLDVSNGNLQDVLKEISAKSDMQIITYGNVSGEINAKLRDIPLTKALALLLGGTMFTFVQKDSIILIGDRNAATPSGQALSKSELIQLKCIKADGVMQILPKDISPANVRVIKEQNALLVSGTSADIVAMRDFVTTVDIPTPQVAISAVIVEYSDNLSKEFGVRSSLHRPELMDKGSFTVPSFATPLGDAATNTDVAFSGEGLKKILNDCGGFLTSGPSSIIGKLPDDFYFALHLLETQSKAKVMAQPSIVTLNGNKASINVSETRYFKMTTGTALSTDYSIRFQPITFGIKLDITPWISQGGQITVEIAPEVSNSSGENKEGGYPNVSSRTISTTVRLKDDETITLGGLIRNTESESHEKIPFFGDIPLIGPLFRTNSKTRQKTNLVVYVTPHIIQQNSKINLDSALNTMEINNNDEFGKKVQEFFNNKLKIKSQKDSLSKDSIRINSKPINKSDTLTSVPAATPSINIAEEQRKSGEVKTKQPMKSSNGLSGNAVQSTGHPTVQQNNQPQPSQQGHQ